VRGILKKLEMMLKQESISILQEASPTTWPLDIEKKLNSNSKLRIKNPKGTFKTLSNTMKQILYKLNHDL
jgi:hypothetical protein